MSNQNGYVLTLIFRNTSDYIHSDLQPKAGDTLVKITGSLPPILSDKKSYDLIMAAGKPGFSFDNFIKDNEGRLVYIKAK